ncbi:unnamed protein product [Protopolystoma xenopodis]|uniref:Uncharacterized protein n=1 Tax=Protopolystoma xenopodis TaxID=117903 RepID=A0A448WJN9_9PLAT|nr:unnamed protein product [Protopolystoma xenopodis]
MIGLLSSWFKDFTRPMLPYLRYSRHYFRTLPRAFDGANTPVSLNGPTKSGFLTWVRD